MNKLDIFNNSAIILNNNTPKKIVSWITILIILTGIIITLSFFPFNIYKTKIGYINIVSNNSYIVLPIDSSDFPVNKNNKLYIKDKQYNYNIEKIETDKLILQVNIDNSLKIQNNIINMHFLKRRTTLFNIFKEKIKKGFGL